MDGPCHKLLSGTALTGDQNCAVHPGDLLQGLKDRLHLRSDSDDPLEGDRFCKPFLKLFHAAVQLFHLQGPCNQEEKLIVVHGLLQVIVGP